MEDDKFQMVFSVLKVMEGSQSLESAMVRVIEQLGVELTEEQKEIIQKEFRIKTDERKPVYDERPENIYGF